MPPALPAVRHVRFTPIALRSNNSFVQLSQWFFYSQGAPIGIAGVSNPGGNSPAGEQPGNVLDGNLGTKWLDFNSKPLVFELAQLSVVDGYVWATGNDAPERDPVRWKLEGSTDGATWVVLDDRTHQEQPVPEARGDFTETWTCAGASQQASSRTSVSILMLVKNNERYLRAFVKLFEKVEATHRGIDFEYHFYENNSTDESKMVLVDFMKSRKGTLAVGNLKPSALFGSVSVQRGDHMVILRNRLKESHGPLDSDVTLMVDSDVLFHPSAIDRFLDALAPADVAMATPFSICWDYYSDNRSADHYYDSLAIITESGLDYKVTNNLCPFEGCPRCSSKVKMCGKQMLSRTGVHSVKSAFGCMAAIKTAVYNQVGYTMGVSVCEHHGFCASIRQHGKVVVDTSIEITVAASRTSDDDYLKMQAFMDGRPGAARPPSK